jgi:uncharacterized protein
MLTLDAEIALAACMLAAAVLYSSVGHAGASAYLALMALFLVTPTTMRPTALALNIVVASFASYRYLSAGLFSWRVLWPFLVGAIPAAFFAGTLDLPGAYYRPLVGLVLLLTAVRLLLPDALGAGRAIRNPPIAAGIAGGTGVGILSGLTGTGGGIFLSPLLLFCGWCDARATSGVAAMFILFASAAALSGNLASMRELPPELPTYAAAVLLGAFIGTVLGIRHLACTTIFKALAIVLVIAGVKLLAFP